MQATAMTIAPRERLQRAWLPVLFAGAILLATAQANAQPHQVVRDGYALRASTVVSTALDPQTARSHGIEREPGRGVLNVMVEKATAPRENVPAEVTAVARNLAGMEREVPMREARAPNGMVSYIGGYEFAPREVLDFIITARPRGHPDELSLEFRDRLPTLQ